MLWNLKSVLDTYTVNIGYCSFLKDDCQHLHRKSLFFNLCVLPMKQTRNISQPLVKVHVEIIIAILMSIYTVGDSNSICMLFGRICAIMTFDDI